MAKFFARPQAPPPPALPLGLLIRLGDQTKRWWYLWFDGRVRSK